MTSRSGPYQAQACAISDEWTYKGMDVVWLENDLLRVGVLAGRGSDIFEFRYKPLDVDFMLRLPTGIRNPLREFSQMRDTANQFEDYYYGGWQEILPNSPTFVYRGASLGQHGEVSLTPWQHAIVADSPARVAVRLWTRPLRMPVLIEKTLALELGSATLRIDERLTNEAATPLDVMWGHHIAFGLPFLREGGAIRTNATRFVADASIPAPRLFKPDVECAWPNVIGADGQTVDASIVPPEGAPPCSEYGFISGFDAGQRAWYTIQSAARDIGFGISWDGSIFRHVWYWLERYASQDAPWWSRSYAVALEPWTTRHDPDAHAQIKRGEWLHLGPKQTISTSLRAAAFEDDDFRLTISD